MILKKDTPANKFEIRNPRWKDRTVLLAKYKVGMHNEVIFTHAKSMPGSYYISGSEAKNYPINSNGKIDCYAIPMNALERLERA